MFSLKIFVNLYSLKVNLKINMLHFFIFFLNQNLLVKQKKFLDFSSKIL
jgi:hypothetical protein